MALTVPLIFRECHRLRKHLRELQLEIDRGPRVLKAQQTRLAQQEQAYKESFDIIKKLKLKQKEDEGALKQCEAQLDKLQTRSMEVTTMKEMDANRNEINTAKGKKEALEDAILTVMTDIEERTANIPNVEQQWKDAQKEFADYQLEAKERLERLIADQAASQAELEKHEKMLPEDVASVYFRLVKGYGPDAMAAVIGRVCQQCRVTLTEDKVGKMMEGAFVCCSICGRALYYSG